MRNATIGMLKKDEKWQGGSTPTWLYEALRRIIEGQYQTQRGMAAIIRGELPDSSGTPLTDTTKFLYKPGLPENQLAYGGTLSAGTLTLSSTAHSTKGKIYFGAALNSAYDEVNKLLGIGTGSPTAVGHFVGNPQPGSFTVDADLSPLNLDAEWGRYPSSAVFPSSSWEYIATNDGATSFIGRNHSASGTVTRQYSLAGTVNPASAPVTIYFWARSEGTIPAAATISFGLVGADGDRYNTTSFDATANLTASWNLYSLTTTGAPSSSGQTAQSIFVVSQCNNTVGFGYSEITNVYIAGNGTSDAIIIAERTAATTRPYEIFRDENDNDLSFYWDGTDSGSVTYPDASGIAVLCTSYDSAEKHYLFDTSNGTVVFRDHFHVSDQANQDILIFCPTLSVPTRGMTLPNAGNPNATFLCWHDATGVNTTGGQPLDGSLLYGDGTNSAMLELAIGAVDTVLRSSGTVPGWVAFTSFTSVEFLDSAFRIVGSATPTKKLAFEVDSLSVGTRTLTPQDASYTIAGLQTANVFTATQTISGSFLTIRNDPGNEALTITNAAGTVVAATIDGNGVGAFADGTGINQPLYLFRGAYGSGTYVVFDVSLLTSGRIITIPDQDGTLIFSGQTITVGLSTSSFLVSDTRVTGASFRDTTVTSKRLRVILSGASGSNAFDIRGTSDIYLFPDLGAGTVTMTMAGSIGALTSTRVPFADASGFLTDSGNMTFVTDTFSVNKVAMSSLSAGRVPFASTAGLLVDDLDLTFSGDTLSATKVAMSSLTSGRVPFASTAGLLIDSNNMTFATDTLTVAKEIISTSLQVAGGAVLTALTAGVYTPTLTNTTNVAASTAYEAQYLRVGNTVTVSGRVDIDPTLAGIATILGISLPVASNFGANEDCCGIMNGSSGTAEAGYIAADTTNDRASAAIIPTAATNQSFYFHFTYQVI